MKMKFYIFIFILIQFPTIVLGFIDGYILEVNPNCAADESSTTSIEVISDLDIFVELTCKDGYYKGLDPVSLIKYTGTAKFSGDSSSECIFVKKEHSRTYTLRLSVGYGEPGSFFFSYQDEFMITCTYDDNTNSDTQQTDIGQSLTAPDEIQRQVSNTAPKSSFQLNITDILGNPVTGSVQIGKKIKLVAEMIPSDLNEIKLVRLCENESKTISCNEGYIRIIEASYGRTDNTICQVVSSDEKCHASSSYLVTSQNCDGKGECVLYASNTVYGDPCSGVIKYLSVTYTCQNHITLCDDESLTLSCDGGESIYINSATFGMRGSSVTTCGTDDPDIPCTSVNAMEIINGDCYGQTSCTVTPSDAAFQHATCSNPIKYLNINYACVKIFILCHSQQGSLTCSDNKKLKIISAEYRYQPENVCSHSVATDSCQSLDALRIVHEACYNKSTCNLSSMPSMFGTFCGDGAMDLVVTYQCEHIETSATAVSCDAVGSTLRYSVLRAGCGDGIIFSQDQGLTTSGTTITSPFFQSFRLYDTENVAFECNFTVCYDTCDGSSCTKTSKRRKRDLSDTSYEPLKQQTQMKNLEGVQQENNDSKTGGSATYKDTQQDKTGSDNENQDTQNDIDLTDISRKAVPDTEEGYENRTGSLDNVDQNMVHEKSEKEKGIDINKKTKPDNVDKISKISKDEVNYPDRMVTLNTKVFKFETQHDIPKVRGTVELVRKNYKINATNNNRNISGQNNIFTEWKNRYDMMSSRHKQIITVYSKSKAKQDTSNHDSTNEHVQKIETSSSDKSEKSFQINPIHEKEFVNAGKKLNTHFYDMLEQRHNKHTFLSIFYITCGLTVCIIMPITVCIIMPIFICFILRKRNSSVTN